jgi:hypothetical protein
VSHARKWQLARAAIRGHASGVSEPAWDRELVLSGLGLVADILANTERIIELLEEDNGEEAEED